LTEDAAKAEIFDKLFGSPKATLHLYQNGANTSATTSVETNAATHEHTALHLTDTALASIMDVYVSVLSENMHNKMFQIGTWTQIEDLWSFLQQVLVRCTLETLFGSALLKQYPRMVRDYLEFNTAVEDFTYGMPRIMVSAAAKPRERLHQGIESWLRANRNEADKAVLASDDSVWDERKGLQFIREKDKAFSNVKGVDSKVRAAEMLGIIHTYAQPPLSSDQNHCFPAILKLIPDSRTNADLISSTFWMTVETLRNSHLVRNMTSSIGQHCSPAARNYDILGLAQTPFVQSVQTEVRRLRTASCVVRTNVTDGFPLDKYWSLPKGATVAMFSYDISLNTDLWRKAHTRAVERPLEEFWPERFLNSDNKTKEARLKSAKNAGVERNKPQVISIQDLALAQHCKRPHWQFYLQSSKYNYVTRSRSTQS
jgi:hypothetical protein